MTPPISRDLIGRHLGFCSLKSSTCCNSPGKCTTIKYKARQKDEFNNKLQQFVCKLTAISFWNKLQLTGKSCKMQEQVRVIKQVTKTSNRQQATSYLQVPCISYKTSYFTTSKVTAIYKKPLML